MVYLAVNCLKEKVCCMLSKIYCNIPYTDIDIEIITIYWTPVHQKDNKAENGIEEEEWIHGRKMTQEQRRNLKQSHNWNSEVKKLAQQLSVGQRAWIQTEPQHLRMKSGLAIPSCSPGAEETDRGSLEFAGLGADPNQWTPGSVRSLSQNLRSRAIKEDTW